MKTPKTSGALRQAPDPMPTYAHFTHMTPLCYVEKIGQTRVAPPPTKSWIRYWGIRTDRLIRASLYVLCLNTSLLILSISIIWEYMIDPIDNWLITSRRCKVFVVSVYLCASVRVSVQAVTFEAVDTETSFLVSVQTLIWSTRAFFRNWSDEHSESQIYVMKKDVTELQLMLTWHHDMTSHGDGCWQTWKKTSQTPVISD